MGMGSWGMYGVRCMHTWVALEEIRGGSGGVAREFWALGQRHNMVMYWHSSSHLGGLDREKQDR